MQNYTYFTIKNSRFLVLLLCLAMLLCGKELRAQQNPDLHFGIHGGGVVTTCFSKGPWNVGSPQTNIGFGGGAFFEWDFGKKKRWFAHLELSVASAKLEANARETDTAMGAFALTAKYLDIEPAVGIGFRFLPRENPFNVHLLACVVGNFPEDNGTPHITIKKQDISKSLDKTFGFRLECGLHYEFAAIVLRYEYEVLPIMKIQGQQISTGHFDFLLRFRFF